MPDPYKCPKCCSEFDKVKATWKKKRLDDVMRIMVCQGTNKKGKRASVSVS